MNKKLILRYLVLTFGFSYILWGIVILLIQFVGMKLTHPLCMTLYLMGTFGPAFGSYLVQKEEKHISGIKEFMKKSFRFRSSVLSYGLVIFALTLYFVYPLISGQMKEGIPVYIAFLLIPLMLVGGGMEEVGWRGVLQPELEKQLQFAVSTVMTSIIWTLWHVPLFFMEGSSQFRVDFIPFFILIIGMSFTQALLYGYSKNVWMSILLHCSFNAFQMAFIYEETLITSIIVSLIMIVGTLLIRSMIMKSKPVTSAAR